MRLPSPLLLILLAVPLQAQDDEPPTRRELAARAYRHPAAVKGGSVSPNWLPDGQGFWYVSNADGEPRVWRVGPEGRRPFESGEPSDVEPRPQRPRKLRDGFSAGSPAVMESTSPDGAWFLGDDERNLYLRAAGSEEQRALTEDGSEDHPWTCQGAAWSADGSQVAVLRANHQGVERIPVVDWVSQPFGQVEYHPYTKAGGVMSRVSLHVFEVESGEQVQLAGSGAPDHYTDLLGFSADGAEVAWLLMDRRYKTLRLQASSATTGATRTVLTETSETFIGALFYHTDKANYLTPVDDERFLWISERDGWRHLYLYGSDGALQRRLTDGDWEVQQVVDVDAEGGWVYLLGHAEPDPYETHLYRVGLDGTGFARLTRGAGEHAPDFSPEHDAFVDVWSSPTSPPRSEYRRADGTLIEVVEEADISALADLGWVPPRPFVAKAADGATDLYGLLYVAHDFDRGRRHPVIDCIYNGPFVKWVPRTFLDGRSLQAQALAELGFVVLIVDGRGTIGRGKAFQDVVHRNWGRNEIPDHAAVLHALAAARPWMDATRVGITGGSWGGYMTLRAMLTHPDVYDVGVAVAAVADLVDHASLPIEGYVGLPEDDPQAYEYASNLRLADQLAGKLLIVHGTADVNATWSAAMKMTHALVQAGKLHDLAVLPGADHWARGRDGQYIERLRMEYFIEHLDVERVIPVGE